ncbi:MAG: MMPL family transporter, partial [Nitriliruptorales bacterium]|nr:MMPL family transporter [Nitriliruptorales bacterium]
MAGYLTAISYRCSEGAGVRVAKGDTPQRAAFAVRLRWAILIVTLAFVAIAGALGGGVADHLSSGGFDDPTAESSVAADLLAEQFDAGPPNLVFLVDAEGKSVDDPGVAQGARALTADLATQPGVGEAVSYWTLGGAEPLRSRDGSEGLILVRLEGPDNELLRRAGELGDTYGGPHETFSVTTGGMSAVFAEVNDVVEADLLSAEAIVFPITLVLLIIIFGSVVAALLPLTIGAFAIVGTFLALRLVAGATEVSIFALNFTTAMGLGLAIDYALLVVSRFREELSVGHDVPVAIRRTLATAGRTVVFSAATVASSLAALLVFRIAFLRSFAYAGIAVVALAAIGAVVVLPALLALIGRNINRLRVRRVRADQPGTGRWHSVAMAVMRRPIPIATVVVLFLAVLGAPFLGVELGFPDDRVLPPGADTRVVGDTIRDEFVTNEAGALNVVMTDVGNAQDHADAIEEYAQRLSLLEGVARVDAVTGMYVGGAQVAPANPLSARFASSDMTYLSVVPSIEPISPAGEDLTRAVRGEQAPFAALIGGGPAELVDGKAGLLDQLPEALALIAAITFVVLFGQFGSLLVPVKAIVLNLLSLSATFGAMVWVFQDGHLAGVLGFTATGSLVTTMPVLMFCIAFGLSMDYEVFLLSRVKEEYDRTGDNVASVATGLERTGRIVTAAAVLIAVVFAAFATGQVSFMKMFGIGMALAVIVDAFLIRATLVPAFMRLAGRANWWAPAPLRRLHDRIGLREHDLDDEVADH